MCHQLRLLPIRSEGTQDRLHHIPEGVGIFQHRRVLAAPQQPTLLFARHGPYLQQRFRNVIPRRIAAGFGPVVLAHRAGLHRTHISMLERGQRTPWIEVVRKLADALGSTMTSLIGS